MATQFFYGTKTNNAQDIITYELTDGQNDPLNQPVLIPDVNSINSNGFYFIFRLDFNNPSDGEFKLKLTFNLYDNSNTLLKSNRRIRRFLDRIPVSVRIPVRKWKKFLQVGNKTLHRIEIVVENIPVWNNNINIDFNGNYFFYNNRNGISAAGSSILFSYDSV